MSAKVHLAGAAGGLGRGLWLAILTEGVSIPINIGGGAAAGLFSGAVACAFWQRSVAMPASEFLKRNAVLGIVGVISAVVVTRLEPFKSNFSLAIMVGVAVGVIASIIEVTARRIANKLKWTPDSSTRGPDHQT